MSCKRGWARLRSDLSLTVQDQAVVRAYQGLNWVSKSSAISKMGVRQICGKIRSGCDRPVLPIGFVAPAENPAAQGRHGVSSVHRLARRGCLQRCLATVLRVASTAPEPTLSYGSRNSSRICSPLVSKQSGPKRLPLVRVRA